MNVTLEKNTTEIASNYGSGTLTIGEAQRKFHLIIRIEEEPENTRVGILLRPARHEYGALKIKIRLSVEFMGKENHPMHATTETIEIETGDAKYWFDAGPSANLGASLDDGGYAKIYVELT